MHTCCLAAERSGAADARGWPRAALVRPLAHAVATHVQGLQARTLAGSVRWLTMQPGMCACVQYVELPEQMAERAVTVLNHRNLGNRYVEVFLSSEGEMSQANVAPPPATNGAPWHMEIASGAGGVVRLRGLPFNATPELILQFFSGYEIPKGAHGVHLILGPNGRPNGEAFVEFPSEEIADTALAKDRGTIGTRCGSRLAPASARRHTHCTPPTPDATRPALPARAVRSPADA